MRQRPLLRDLVRRVRLVLPGLWTEAEAPAPAPAGPEPVRLEAMAERPARRYIEARAWGRAQRALEAALRERPDPDLQRDLEQVRTIRRALRRLARWPGDVEAHLALAYAYFDLDLGDEALATLQTVTRLAPERVEGHLLLALEYLYRGETEAAARAYAEARRRRGDLPPLADLAQALRDTA